MLGRRKKFFEDSSFAVDVFAAGVFLVAVYQFLNRYNHVWQDFLRNLTGYYFNIQTTEHLRDQGWLLLAILVCHFVSFKANRYYQLDLFAGFGRIAFECLKCTVIGIALTTLFFYFFSIIKVNRSLLFGFACVFFAYSVVKEKLYRQYLLKRYYTDKPMEALLVAPAATVAKRLQKLAQRQLASVRVTQVVLTDGTPDDVSAEYRQLISDGLETLPEILSQGRFDLVFYSDDGHGSKTAKQVISHSEEQGIEVWYLADFIEPALARPHVDEYGGQPVIVFKTTSHIEGKRIVKRVFDLCVTSIVTLSMLPVFVAIALAVRIDSKGPIFFTQERTGYRGKPFRMLKFRTMVVDAEAKLAAVRGEANEMSGPVFKRGDDPRITKVGAFLRRYSLDELPQLLNILRGDMSLVGPRPLPVYETQKFEAFQDHRRYSVLPGLTGLWQISGRNTITDFREWVRLDLEYIDRWSLWLDVTIILKTFPVVLKGVGAK